MTSVIFTEFFFTVKDRSIRSECVANPNRNEKNNIDRLAKNYEENRAKQPRNK